MANTQISVPATSFNATSVAADAESVGRTITFPALLSVLRRNLLWVGFAMLCATGLAAIALAVIPPRYHAEAVLVVKKRPLTAPAEGLVAPPSTSPLSEGELKSAVDYITGTLVLEDVAASLRLDRDPDFNPAVRFENVDASILEWISSVLSTVFNAINAFLSPVAFNDPHLDVISSLGRALEVSVKEGSNSVSIKATARDPRKAANLANAVATAAVRQNLAERTENTTNTEGWLNERLAELRVRVTRGQEEIERLRTSTGLFDGQTSSLTSEQLSQLSKELLEARSQLAAAQAQREEITRLGRIPDGLAAVNEVLSSATIRTLREQESLLAAKVAAEQEKLGPLHPSLISVKEQLTNVQQKIAAETGRITSDVSDRIRRWGTQVTNLERAQAALMSKIEGQSTAAVRLAELRRDTDSDRTLYEAFAIFGAKTAGLSAIQRPDMEIVSPALPLRVPQWPNRKVVLGATALGVLCLGLFIVVLRASIDERLRSAEQIAALLGLPTAALIPRVTGRLDPAETALAAPSSAVAESIRDLYVAVDAARRGQSGFRVLISSALPKEGKSSTALMLARQAAAVGIRTLLVRFDLRQLPRSAVTEVDYAVDVTDDVDSGIAILTVLPRGHETFKVLFRSSFWDQFHIACRGYDLVVIDSPPILSVSEAKVIARFSDMTIFLVKWGATTAGEAGEALRQFQSVSGGANCAVLTQVNPRQYAHYGYGDYGSRSWRTATTS